MIKPKLRSSQKVTTLPDDTKPSLSNNIPVSFVEFETISWGQIIKGWMKNIALFFLLAAVLAVAVYAGLAATVAYAVKIDGNLYSVARGTYVGNEIPSGEIVYGSEDTALQDDILSKLVQGANPLVGNNPVPNPIVVEVIDGPVMKIQVQGNQVTFNPGQDDEKILTGKVEGLTDKTTLLSEQYVVECKWGACEPGTYFVLPAENISGQIERLQLGSK